MSRNFVYSTLTSNQKYVKWKVLDNGMQMHDGYVLIHGGANVATGSAPKTITPRGVVTKVSDEELDLLMNDFTFKRHMENGFIKVEKYQDNADKVAKDMAPKDDSAPRTPEDLAPKTESDATLAEPKTSLLSRISGSKDV